MSGVEEFVSSGAAPAERMIRDLVDCEHSYINTDHANFIGGSRAIAQARAEGCRRRCISQNLADLSTLQHP